MNRVHLSATVAYPDTFETVSYRDSIKIVDISAVCRFLKLKRFGSCRLWVVTDICGGICVVFTYSLIIFAECIACFALFCDFLDSLHTALHATIFQCCTALAVASHIVCMFTDPGAVPRGNATRENIAKFNFPKGLVIYRCPKCICVKPDRAHHCRVCRRCVRKMDHHCPWVNNCIGEDNQKYFILFTMYTCIISCHALYLSVCQLMSWKNESWKGFCGHSPTVVIILLALLILEAVIFGVFTGVMFFNQMWAVSTDETYIERLKKDDRERLSSWLAIKEVFGHPFSYRWFSPFHAGPRAPVTVEVLEAESADEQGSSGLL